MRQIFFNLNIVIRTQRPNFNNPDGSFNRDAWIDFMNNAIQSIPYINSWNADTVHIQFNAGGKDNKNRIMFAPSSCIVEKMEYNSAHKINGLPVPMDNYHFVSVWDSEKGWTYFPNRLANYISDTDQLSNEKLDDDYIKNYGFEARNKGQIQLFALDKQHNMVRNFVVVYPDRTWRYLGKWEYASLGLKKFIPYKIKKNLEKYKEYGVL
jgi:hypothetical protein